MAGFKFRLSQLLQLRNTHRDQCREQLARAIQAESEILQSLEDHQLEIESHLNDMRTASRDATYSVSAVQRRRQYLGTLTNQTQATTQQLEQARLVVQHCRQALAAADQQVRMLEKMSDRQASEYQQLQERREQSQREEAWMSVHFGGADR